MSDSNLNIDGQVKISFSPGKMHAYLEVSAPIGSGAPCKREQVLKALQEYKIDKYSNNENRQNLDQRFINELANKEDKGMITLGEVKKKGDKISILKQLKAKNNEVLDIGHNKPLNKNEVEL
ncbi:MAG: hypothetical protein GX382_13630 [Syntrophomonadaceae bacterium]|nr:hypothetical protein [Syntrophomonadaceae bacterium]